MAKKNQKRRNKNRRERKKNRFPLLPPEVWSKIFSLFLFLFALIFLLGFFNKAGIGGEYLLKFFFFLIGKTIYILPLILALAGFFIFKGKYHHYFLPSCLAILLLILGIASILSSQDQEKRLGGVLGYFFSWPFLKLFGFWVSQIIFLTLLLVGGIIFLYLWRGPQKEKVLPSLEIKEPIIKKEALAVKEEKSETKVKRPLLAKMKIKKPKLKPRVQKVLIKKERFLTPPEQERKKITPYPLSLLEPERGKPNSGDINKNSLIIKKTLENFEIFVEMKEVNVGPTVTQYTLKPAEGIKLSKITALANNLALALASHPIRIEAPIPGKPLVGIEVPNKERVEVRLRNLLERPEFQKAESILVFALGRDVAGVPVFADLAKMPHLLVAGATGTGKTIFLNSLILSLLYKNSPETLRFILIDPKRVEFSLYQDLPYLLSPVIFETDKTVLALKWLISEMEKRFRILSAVGVRDIKSYNRIARQNQNLKKFERGEGNSDEVKIMPYIVLIIDELADLMVAKGREMEAGIVRLAQMARAVGIHLVVATQRPSVEVLTGLIKANITSRVTFQVATQVDSRTVLDMAGAEKLLGAGDMLFLAAQTPKPKRMQAPFVSEEEVKKVIEWLKKKEDYFIYNALHSSLVEALKEEVAIGEERIEETSLSGKSDDVLYEEAKRVVIEAGKASASLLQRRLRIGYARAARLLDMLEARGIIGPAEGAKPRKVYGGGEKRKEKFDEYEANI